MRKLFTILAVAATLASCAKEDVVSRSADEAITFDNVFVDNATRAAYDASYTATTLESFQVYGTVTGEDGEGTGNIFNAETVTKGAAGTGADGGWAYDAAHTQYWIPGNDYAFFAIAEGNVENVTATATSAETATIGMPTTITLSDASAQKDILTADFAVENYAKGANGAEPVKFTFKHILAKAKFTFKNGVTTNNGYSYKVTNVEIIDAPKDGVYAITNGTTGTWTIGAEDYILAFGNVVATGNAANNAEVSDLVYNASAESNYDRLLIPGEQTLNIRFDYQLLKDGNVIDTQVDVLVVAADVNLESGHAYNFVISLDNPGDPITFALEDITDWVNEDPTNL